MSTASTGVGAAMLPLQLDPSIMLSSAGSINPLRRLARVVTTASNQWQGVLSAGATAEWKTEAAEAGDGSPTLSSPSIDVYSGDVFVPYSHELGQDVPTLFEELSRITLAAADNLQSAAFTTGNGSSEWILPPETFFGEVSNIRVGKRTSNPSTMKEAENP